MKDHPEYDICREDNGPCDCLTEPVRMNYFHGQLISERDLRTEQTYFREKLRHAHRCLHGYGILCGMEVHPLEPPQDCLPDDSATRRELRERIAATNAKIDEIKQLLEKTEDEAEREKLVAEIEVANAEIEELTRELEALTAERPDQSDECEEEVPLHRVRITCGAAIDCDGNDLILARDRVVDVIKLLSPSDRDKLTGGEERHLWLSICYEECGREPTRPLAMEACSTFAACQMARIAEGVRVVASLEAPKDDARCDPCCDCCDDPCLVLARITVSAGEPIVVEDIDHSVRRRFGLYDPTVIKGINWAHGATYSSDVADGILGSDDENGGIVVSFSRPVHVSTVQQGTVSLYRYTRGGGLAGVVISMEGEFVGLPEDEDMVSAIRFRNTTGESVQPNDQIMIVVRAPFLLDRCCRPVEGLHVGGKVPRLHLENDAADDAARAEEEKASDAVLKAKEKNKAKADEKDPDGPGKRPPSQVCDSPPWGPMPWTTNGPGNFESWFWVAGKGA